MLHFVFHIGDLKICIWWNQWGVWSVTWMYSFFSPHSHALFLSSLLQVFGMLVWILVGGTEYFHLSALCWVMFVAILCWVLTICLFIMYLTGAHNRIPQVPWTTLVKQTLTFQFSVFFFAFLPTCLTALSLYLLIFKALCLNCSATATATAL